MFSNGERRLPHAGHQSSNAAAPRRVRLRLAAGLIALGLVSLALPAAVAGNTFEFGNLVGCGLVGRFPSGTRPGIEQADQFQGSLVDDLRRGQPGRKGQGDQIHIGQVDHEIYGGWHRLDRARWA